MELFTTYTFFLYLSIYYFQTVIKHRELNPGKVKLKINR